MARRVAQRGWIFPYLNTSRELAQGQRRAEGEQPSQTTVDKMRGT
jgi:hypothetical protein